MVQFLTILIVIAAIILTLVVLMQNSKGGGLAASFASANQVFGVKKTTDGIEKLTWILIAIIVVLSIFSARMIGGANNNQSASQVDVEQVQQQQQAPAVPIAPIEQPAQAN